MIDDVLEINKTKLKSTETSLRWSVECGGVPVVTLYDFVTL